MRFYPFYVSFFLFLFGAISLYGQEIDYAPGKVIVQYKQAIQSDQRLSTLASKYNNKYNISRALYPEMGIYLLNFDPFLYTQEEVIAELSRDRDIRFVQSNSLVAQRTTVPDDPFYSEQEYLDIISAAEAWDVTTGGSDVNGREIVMAVMDRGFDIEHEDLAQNVWINNDEIPDDGLDNDGNQYVDDYLGWNFEFRSDSHGFSTGTMIHGTNVAGIAAARGDNDTGISGAIWDVKILFMSGLRSEAEIIEAYRYIADTRRRYNESNGQEGAYIVASTMSLGISGALSEDHPVWCELYDIVGQHGVLSVCATDNADVDVDAEGDMPTTCTSEFMIAVTNTDSSNRKTSPAAFGNTSIDIGAPGVENITTSPNDNYNRVTGTSVSAPLVGGAIALLYSAPCQSLADQALINPSDLALTMKNIVYGGSDKNPALEDITSQGGVLNILGSMELLDLNCNGEDGVASSISVQPNPIQQSTENITIDYLAAVEGEIFIRIYDTKGALIFEKTVVRSFFGENRIQINTGNNLSSGLYLITLDLPGNQSMTEKLVVY